MKKKSNGYSLIELSIALAILSVVIVSSLVGVQRILQNNAANNLLKEVPLVAANLTVAFATTPSTGGFDTAQGVDLGIFPANKVDLETDPVNPVLVNSFNGVDQVRGLGVAWGTYPADRGFIYTMQNIPQSMCTTMAQGLESLATAIVVHNTPAYDLEGDATFASVAINASAAPNFLVKAPGVRNINRTELASACSPTLSTTARSISILLDRS